MLNDIALFVHVVEQRGLARAAQYLHIAPATVTRRLQALEERLGCRLMHRSARRFHLTAEGESYYQAFCDQVRQFEATARDLSQQVHQLSGPLKVQAPTNISLGILQPMWSAFLAAHPDIQLDLRLNNRVEDMLSAGTDLALRAGPQEDSALFQKHLGAVMTVLVAAPGYLETAGEPQQLAELNGHRLIRSDTLPVWTLTHGETGRCESVHAPASTTLNDISLVRDLTCDGHGISLLPVSEVHEALASGRLKRVLSDWQGPKRDLYAIWPSGCLLNARAKALRDFMVTYIGNEPILQGAIPA